MSARKAGKAKKEVKRGIIIHHPSAKGVVSYTLTGNKGEWIAEGRIRSQHYSPESMQFLWGFLDHNAPKPEWGSPAAMRRFARAALKAAS